MYKVGGGDSIHITSTKIAAAIANKQGVRILLKNGGDTKAEIEKITVNAPCVLEAESENSAFSKVSVAGGVKNVTLRGKTKIEQLVVASSKSKILVGSNDIQIEKGADICGNSIDSYLASEDGKADITLPTVKPLDITPTWKIWTDEAYTGTAVIDDFTENSISVTTSKTPDTEWHANMNFVYKVEKEFQYMIEFDAKHTGTQAETSFNIFDITKEKNVAVAPFTPTNDWKKYRFMVSLNSAGTKYDGFDSFENDEIQFEFRLTQGTLFIKDFKVYNCWEDDFLQSDLNKWDTWFAAGGNVATMLYEVEKDGAKAIRTVQYDNSINDYPKIDSWETNMGYKLGELQAGRYYFAFESYESTTATIVNLHIASNGNSKELGFTEEFDGNGSYYITFDISEPLEITVQFQNTSEPKSWIGYKVAYTDISNITWGKEDEFTLPSGAKQLTYTPQEN